MNDCSFMKFILNINYFDILSPVLSFGTTSQYTNYRYAC